MRTGDVLPGPAQNCQGGTKPSGRNGSRRHQMQFWKILEYEHEEQCFSLLPALVLWVPVTER